ncbi:MAG: DUF368 domain-containing protein [Eubacteriales bacterium]|nr:DUF368 domain-containing protein [Eubacteriales bacterium]
MAISAKQSPVHEQRGPGFDPPQDEGLQAALVRFLKGMLIGIGAILPGLSGGVLAVIFKLYGPIMRFLGHPFYRLGANFLFFLPLGLGAGVGVFIFAFLVSAALGSYEAFFTCLFIGLVLGTFPSLWREAGLLGRVKRDVVVMALAALLIFVMMVWGGQTLVTVHPNTLIWFIVGAVVGLGVVVPGLSPSNFLMYFGLYKPMSDAIKTLGWPAVLPLALGGLACVFVLAKPFNFLLEKRYTLIYHIILGLVLGSSLAIFPTVVAPGLSPASLSAMSLSLGPALLLCGGALVIGAVLSLLFNRLDQTTTGK